MKKISGNGSIYYKPKQKYWVAQYVLTENGKKKQKYIYGKTKDEVSRKLTELMYNYHNNNFIQKNGIPLIKLLKQNREDRYAANLISDSHYSRLEYILKHIEENDLGNMNIDEITSRDIQNYVNSLITDYSDSSIRKIWEQLKQGFEIAKKEKYILENPFENVLKPKSRKETKIIEALTVEEQDVLSRYLLESDLSKEKYKTVFLLQLYTGMRIGEVLALTEKDIDFNKKLIYVNRTLTRDKYGVSIVGNKTKTYSGKREIPIHNFLIPLLKEQLANYVDNPNKLLFSHEKRSIPPSALNSVLKRICKQLNIERNVSNHILRHTFGTRCVESGMTAVVVQRLMGHKDVNITLNTYTSVFNRFKQEELNKVASLYLENNFLTLSNNVLSLDDKNYSIETDEHSSR